MKPLFIILTIISAFFGSSANANDEINVAPLVQQSFQRSFAQAKDIHWTVRKDYYKVDFELSGQYVTAFYNTDGKFIAATRNISSTQLPVVLQADLKKGRSDFWITELFELSNDEGVSYFLTLENADAKIILQSSGTEWNVYQRTSK